MNMERPTSGERYKKESNLKISTFTNAPIRTFVKTEVHKRKFESRAAHAAALAATELEHAKKQVVDATRALENVQKKLQKAFHEHNSFMLRFFNKKKREQLDVEIARLASEEARLTAEAVAAEDRKERTAAEMNRLAKLQENIEKLAKGKAPENLTVLKRLDQFVFGKPFGKTAQKLEDARYAQTVDEKVLQDMLAHVDSALPERDEKERDTVEQGPREPKVIELESPLSENTEEPTVLQDAHDEEDAFDEMIAERAFSTVNSELMLGKKLKWSKEKKQFFEHLDRRDVRPLPWPEALRFFLEAKEDYVSGKSDSESALIFAAMDLYCVKYTNDELMGTEEAELAERLRREKIYEATVYEVMRARNDRTERQKREGVRWGGPVRKTISKKRSKKKRAPWLVMLGSIAALFGTGAGVWKATEAYREQPVAARTHNSDVPQGEPVYEPSLEGTPWDVEPAPRISFRDLHEEDGQQTSSQKALGTEPFKVTRGRNATERHQSNESRTQEEIDEQFRNAPQRGVEPPDAGV
jgi:hypothetical protein